MQTPWRVQGAQSVDAFPEGVCIDGGIHGGVLNDVYFLLWAAVAAVLRPEGPFQSSVQAKCLAVPGWAVLHLWRALKDFRAFAE